MNDFSLNSATLAGYLISDLDDSSDPKYYGFLDKFGNWYIMQENVASKTYRYCKGASGYTAAWTNRASQSYDYVTIFNH